jgi:2-polyprenyl-3-methyl-5-hydroxy-6-metoxy-1,4-benzoquinol methylase
VWADPNLGQAAEFMRHVVENPEEAAARAARGHQTIVDQHSVDRMAEFAGRRLAEVADLETDRTSAETPAQLAEQFLIRGPSVPWDVPSARLGPFGVYARGFLRRFLRPYLLRQREWESAVVDALRQSEVIAERQARRVNTELRELRERFDHLEGQLYSRPFAAELDEKLVGGRAEYRSFEDVFRGSEERIRELLVPYVDLLRGHEPVLDAGCGRGELLDLLREAEIEATGVDIDEGMVERAREKGHTVELADVVDYLGRLPDGKFGAIVAIHVIEHLPYEGLLRFLHLAREKLAPDGLLVVETVNPHSLQAFKTFWTDLTHRAPIFPEVASALATIQGFESVRVIFPRGTGDDDLDLREETEYALVAKR